MALLLHVLMLVLLSGGSAKVVKDFERECGQFFANGKSPTRFPGQQYKQICQTLNGVPYYATYYDTKNRIPVYSAYRFEGIMGCERKRNWYIEPQLDDTIADMASEGSVHINRGVNQALNGDYEGSGYHKGHLAPVYLAESQDCADATFTLTNAAPQNPSFNRVQWWGVEKQLAGVSKQCLNNRYSVFIVTGVVPGIGTLKKENMVTVPSHFWTAYCCLDNNKKCSESGGAIGINKAVSTIIYYVKTDMAKFEEDLKNLYGTSFKLFQ